MVNDRQFFPVMVMFELKDDAVINIGQGGRTTEVGPGND